MAKGAPFDAGFDVIAATKTLHELALNEGAVPRDDWRAKDPFLTASAHAFVLHGLGGERCGERPCRLGGVCFALYEVTTYGHDRTGPRSALALAADATEQAATALEREFKILASLLAALEQAAQDRHQLEGNRAIPLHDHDLLCIAPVLLTRSLATLAAQMRQFASAVRRGMSSAELRQSSSTKRKKILLNAVYQHLHWGGLSYSEIASLIPDGLGPSSAADRVRKRVKSADARTLIPADLLDERGGIGQ